MASGPEHYTAAEEFLVSANANRLHADRIGVENEFHAKAILDQAELDMKAAHVHAMLAVAAASVQLPSIMSPTTFTIHYDDWRALLAATTPKEN